MCVVAALGLYLWATSRSDEPVIRGHPLTYWMLQLFPNAEESPKAIDAAFAEMDEHCIDFMIRQLRWRPSAVIDKLNEFSDRMMHTEPFRQPPDGRVAAAIALSKLGPRAVRAIPALEGVLRSYGGGGGEENGCARGAALAALVLIRHEPIQRCAEKAIDYFGSDPHDNLSAIYYLERTPRLPCRCLFTRWRWPPTKARSVTPPMHSHTFIADLNSHCLL